jgi:hypothetical protein
MIRRFLTVLLFFFCLQTTAAQNSWRSFWKLTGPEKAWVLFHPFAAGRAFRITKEAIRVAEEMKTDTLLDGDAAGGQVDAFRHGYWMAALSQKMCWKKALSLGRAHERGNYRLFRKGREEFGELPDSISGVMDLFNNRVGAGLGCEKKDAGADTLKIIIRSCVLSGKMKIIHKNREGVPLDSLSRPIDRSLFKNRWKIPKTLVRSDTRRTE